MRITPCCEPTAHMSFGPTARSICRLVPARAWPETAMAFCPCQPKLANELDCQPPVGGSANDDCAKHALSPRNSGPGTAVRFQGSAGRPVGKWREFRTLLWRYFQKSRGSAVRRD